MDCEENVFVENVVGVSRRIVWLSPLDTNARREREFIRRTFCRKNLQPEGLSCQDLTIIRIALSSSILAIDPFCKTSNDCCQSTTFDKWTFGMLKPRTSAAKASLIMIDHDENNSVSPDPLHNNIVETKLSKSESALNFAFLSFLGFTILQFIFAVAARSDAMLADCVAMTVDAMTYLFNYGAERMKHRLEADSNDNEGDDHDDDNLHTQRQDNKRELQRLLLELIPPSISALTLMVVTILTLTQSIQVISSDIPKENPPNITIMLVFSTLNLVLDGFNVLEFSRVDHVVLSMTNVHHEHARHYHHHHHHRSHSSGPPTEATQLLAEDEDDMDDVISHCSMDTDLNLNMCSAWTHIAADTLRSIAVLLAASFSSLFPHLLSPMDADSLGAILVSIVILISLFPLIQGIYNTAWEIQRLLRQ